MEHDDDYSVIHGLKVNNNKIKQLTEWRKKQAQEKQ